MSAFTDELQHLINRFSMENGSDTPDFILAGFLADCLAAWNHACRRREEYYGRSPKPANPPAESWPAEMAAPTLGGTIAQNSTMKS